ncbi:1,5-anhydro-D-fructose reductase-like [Saccostrea echinata]|uniref:1,5-anhydro-D-fructose reductase-like n=1 Tax=Saccostrea echinata TaxID=191078 RepID=UPI002A814B00|nr:1,5-anhydro-D-fructose reductase-like [Saccostrea echinata]
MSITSDNQVILKLGNKGRVPALGFGTYAPRESEDDVYEAVRVAIKTGYRHLDCAAIYRNERAVGQAIKQTIVEDKVRREDLFITSKLWNSCHRPDLVRTSLKKSMEDLGLQYLDLYLIHWPIALREGGEFIPKDEKGNVLFSDVDYVDTWKAMEDCVDEGLVKYIGLSNFNSEQIQRILDVARIKPVMNQVECHIYLSQEKLIEFCKARGITVTAYSPFASPGHKSIPYTPCLQEPVIVDIAKSKQKTPSQIILRFLLQRGLVVIPKSVSPGRIVENFQVFDFELTDEEMKKILALNKNHRINTEDIALTHKYYPFNIEF